MGVQDLMRVMEKTFVSSQDAINAFRPRAWKISRKEIERPEWHDYFMGLACVAALRSHDANTNFGAIVVSGDNQILGIGYNGFPRGKNDNSLPNVRPVEKDEINKLSFMVHAECNALYNCATHPRLVGGASVYVGGMPCNSCLLTMSQNLIHTVYYLDRPGLFADVGNEEAAEVRRMIVEHTGIKLVKLEKNIEWIKRIFKDEVKAVNELKTD